MSYIVRAATETAANASISTPVLPDAFAIAVISMQFVFRIGSNKISTESMFKGWHKGIKSPTFFAAMMPAIFAVPRTSPFLISFARTAFSVSFFIKILPFATASRSVISLAVTSTIRALPFLSIWVSFGIRYYRLRLRLRLRSKKHFLILNLSLNLYF